MHSWLSIIFLKISEFRDVFWVCYFVLPVDYLGVCRGGSRGNPARAPLKLEKIRFFGVKSWFFIRNTPKYFAPPSARRNFLSAPPNLKSSIRPWMWSIISDYMPCQKGGSCCCCYPRINKQNIVRPQQIYHFK